MLLPALQQASVELDRHEAQIREGDEATARVARGLFAYRAYHERWLTQ